MTLPTVPFRDAVAYWCKLGLTSFGGPAGQISMLHDEVVVKRRWISEKRFLHAVNYCMVLPGPEAQQLVTYIGWLMHGVRGGVIAGTLFILPSLIVLIVLSGLYVSLGSTPFVAGIFEGIKPVVVAIIALAVYRIGSRSLNHPLLWCIAVVSTGVMLWSGSWFPVIVVVAALVGWTVARFRPGIFSVPGEHLSAATDRAPAIIDDDTPTPSHARVTRGRFVRTTVVSIALWLIPIGAVLATVGVANPLFAMALFFSGAAFLTFGGAYAVLPYVFHGAVSAGWATPTQMIDGLALGESTPGPLIMFVSFVGFVGGFGGEFLVTGTSLVSGVVAAIIVTWFTFLPSFYFVLAGGPFVEASRNRVAFTAPLTAINAAVAGVVLSLAITFAGTVLVPTGEPVNLFGLVVTVVAGFALFQLKRSILEVIAGGFVVGIYLGVVATFSG